MSFSHVFCDGSPCLGHSPRTRRAQGPTGGNAAILIIIITALLVLYILFLPPADRDKLLNSGGSSSDSGSVSDAGSASQNVLLSENVGTITAITNDRVTHDMPSFHIFDTTKSAVVKQISSLYVKRSALSSQSENMTFALDPTVSKNVKLSFNVRASSGFLIIRLNGQSLATVQLTTGSPEPIPIPDELLKDENVLTFETNSPGIAFWRVNEYLMDNIVVAADITDLSALRAEQSFSIASAEAQNLDTATLFFIPDCERNTVGPLDIILNNQRIYRSVADCGVMNNVELDKSTLVEGKNTIVFQTTTGSYLIDQLVVKTSLKQPITPAYSFDLGSKYFALSSTQDRLCGEADGACPDGCTADKDPDCCFQENTYWCTMSTYNINDRCVAYASGSQCGLCKSGYQDQSGDPAPGCAGLCGDNTDGICPSGCTAIQDKDCCYSASQDNYWCNEVPTTGAQDKCTPNVGQGQCGDCASGYENGHGDTFSCDALKPTTTEDKLLAQYDVNASLTFTGDDSKRFDLVINGVRVSVDTTARYYSRIIDGYLQPGTNTVEIVPKGDAINVVKLSVTLKKRS